MEFQHPHVSCPSDIFSVISFCIYTHTRNFTKNFTRFFANFLQTSYRNFYTVIMYPFYKNKAIQLKN